MAGRGGVGNIEQANRQSSPDPEANWSMQSSAPEDADERRASVELKDKQIASMGRGGAGNYYSPAALAQTGTFDTADTNGADSQKLSRVKSNKEAQASSTATSQGRGGAGNFAWKQSDNANEAGELEDQSKAVRARVEKDVELGLEKPGKVYLGKSPQRAGDVEEASR